MSTTTPQAIDTAMLSMQANHGAIGGEPRPGPAIANGKVGLGHALNEGGQMLYGLEGKKIDLGLIAGGSIDNILGPFSGALSRNPLDDAFNGNLAIARGLDTTNAIRSLDGGPGLTEFPAMQEANIMATTGFIARSNTQPMDVQPAHPRKR